MATNGGGTGPWEARCPDYYRRFKTQIDAERWAADVERMGNCPHQHTVTKVG